MTRPAIVIGLGGTGQWILTFLKKDLMEIGNGVMPAGVRMLSFDTEMDPSVRIGQQKQDVRLGSIRLVKNVEYIPISDGRLNDLAHEINRGKHPHMGWFPAEKLISKLGTVSTLDGAGAIRHLGRLALFYDLQQGQRSQIISNVRAAIEGLKQEVNDKRMLEFIIVASLAGGTGAGMLIDMALLLRQQARELGVADFMVRGFFVMPSAFSRGQMGGESDRMYANSFAAWRELDRFMIVSSEFGIPQVNYHATNKTLQIRASSRPYDITYLLDPNRSLYSLSMNQPSEGLYPAVADCISTVLDEKAGQDYTNWVTVNLKAERQVLPNKPYHSAIGSYTIKMPAYYVHTNSAHSLAIEALHELLAPELDEATGRVVRLSDTYNREVDQSDIGLTAALNFLGGAGVNIEGTQVPNSLLLPIVSEIRRRNAVNDAKIIDQVAKGGMTGINGSERRFVRGLTDIGQDDEGKQIAREIQDELIFEIWKARGCGLSREVGDKPDAALGRLSQRVPEERAKHYGVDTAAGQRLRGEFGKALEKAKKAQIARFDRLLQSWLYVTLNGTSPDIYSARGGKIGWVSSALEGMKESCQYFTQFIGQVKKHRSETLRVTQIMKQRRDSALAYYKEHAGDKTLAGRVLQGDEYSPTSYEAQSAYFEAEQADIDARKDDILIDVLVETVSDIQDMIEKTITETQRWIMLLATGDPSRYSEIPGLYNALYRSLDDVNVNQELDESLKNVNEMIGKHEYYSEPEFVSEALGRLVWEVKPDKDGAIRLVCGAYIGDEDKAKFYPFVRSGADATERNIQTILALTEYRYEYVKTEQFVAKEIIDKYVDPVVLAEHLLNRAEPFYLPSAVRAGAKKVTSFIRINDRADEETINWFGKFQAAFKNRQQSLQAVQPTLSEDQHKMTVIRSDDLMPSEDFDLWHQCYEAYIRLVDDPNSGVTAAELHVFPAEINACKYEIEIPRELRKGYRTLQPEVVALLEDREKFEIFFRCLALGLIYMQPGDTMSNTPDTYIFDIPKNTEPIYLTKQSKSLSEETGGQDAFFDVVNAFVVKGTDQRQGYERSLWVEYEEARQAIIQKQNDLGADATVAAYQEAIDKGIVATLRTEMKYQRSREQNPVLKPLIAREYEDLSDVAELIYRRAIKAMKPTR